MKIPRNGVGVIEKGHVAMALDSEGEGGGARGVELTIFRMGDGRFNKHGYTERSWLAWEMMNPFTQHSHLPSAYADFLALLPNRMREEQRPD